MALIQCPECRHDVSEAAASCPQCGHPIGSPTDPVRSERTITTQETGKDVKVHQIAGISIFIAGAIIAVQMEADPVDAWMMAGGLLYWLGAKVVGWWQYG